MAKRLDSRSCGWFCSSCGRALPGARCGPCGAPTVWREGYARRAPLELLRRLQKERPQTVQLLFQGWVVAIDGTLYRHSDDRLGRDWGVWRGLYWSGGRLCAPEDGFPVGRSWAEVGKTVRLNWAHINWDAEKEA